MLTIQNVDTLIGKMCYGREIYHISNNVNTLNECAYVFEFDAIEDGNIPKGYNKIQQVHLMRHTDTNGDYKLFLMGLGMVTERWISKKDLKDKHKLLVEISICLSYAKHWWNNK